MLECAFAHSHEFWTARVLHGFHSQGVKPLKKDAPVCHTAASLGKGGRHFPPLVFSCPQSTHQFFIQGPRKRGLVSVQVPRSGIFENYKLNGSFRFDQHSDGDEDATCLRGTVLRGR